MIRFYVMGEKGLAALHGVVDAGHKSGIHDVVYATDRDVSDDKVGEILSLCDQIGVKHYLRKDAPRFDGRAIAISWRWLIHPSQDLIVLHDSLLPRYRGFAPLVAALKNGDREIGVTALLASERFDEGPIIAQASTEIRYPIRIAEAITTVSQLCVQLAVELVSTIQSGASFEPVEQRKELATYSLWLDDEDYRISWDGDAAYIERFVHAVGSPYKGATTIVGDEITRVLDGLSVEDITIEERMPGKVMFVNDGSPVIVCGSGLYKITDMRRDDGSSALPLKRFRVRLR